MRRMALLAAVAGAHSAYYLAPEGQARAWTAYVGTHALVVVALALLLPWAGSARPEWMAAVGAVACWWGILESAQAVGCGIAMWGALSNADLCEQAFGRELYILAASLGIAWAVAGALRCRKREAPHG